MKKIIFLIAVLAALLSCSANAQITTRTSLLTNVQSSTGSGPAFTILAICTDELSKYNATDVVVGNKLFVLDGSECYELTVDSILTAAGSILQARVYDSLSVLSYVPTGQGAIISPYITNRVPFIPSGLRGDLAACILQKLASTVNNITGGGSTLLECSDTITKTSHGFTVGTPIRYNGSAWVSMVGLYGDSLVADLVVTSVINANSFVGSVCGVYANTASLAAGDYYQIDSAPGYNLGSGDTATVILFSIKDNKMIVNPMLGFGSSSTDYSAGTGISIVDGVITNTAPNGANDLTTSTTFGGDVSGTYDNLQLGTGVVGATELASTAVTPGSYTNADITADL